MAEVRLQKVNKSYDDVQVVFDADLEIKSREFVVLVGPSGCGKSTTLRMIAGLEEITSGDISIGDRRVNDLAPKDRDIAMVFQSYALYPHMSVFENMAFGLRLRRMPKDQIQARVKDAAHVLGLTELLDRKPKALSGGQRQRVAMGRAIVRRPSVFLFDEPLSNLDAKLRVQMRTEIAKLHRRYESTSIYVTHDQVEAMTLADRIVVMKDGIIQQVGTPMELYKTPNNLFVATFIGSPAMNVLHGEVLQESDRFFFVREKTRIALADSWKHKLTTLNSQKVSLGIRPQCIELTSELSRADVRDCQLQVCEPLGAETFLYFQVGEGEVIARVDGIDAPQVGDNLNLRFQPDQILLFDKESGLTLS